MKKHSCVHIKRTLVAKIKHPPRPPIFNFFFFYISKCLRGLVSHFKHWNSMMTSNMTPEFHFHSAHVYKSLKTKIWHLLNFIKWQLNQIWIIVLNTDYYIIPHYFFLQQPFDIIYAISRKSQISNIKIKDTCAWVVIRRSIFGWKSIFHGEHVLETGQKTNIHHI